MRAAVVAALSPLHAFAVENPALPGTPDIYTLAGWIETKWMREWPKRPSTRVKVKRFSPEQRAWLRRHAACGGRAWVLLAVNREWLLLDGELAADRLDYTTRRELLGVASEVWQTKDEALPGLLRKLRVHAPSRL